MTLDETIVEEQNKVEQNYYDVEFAKVKDDYDNAVSTANTKYTNTEVAIEGDYTATVEANVLRARVINYFGTQKINNVETDNIIKASRDKVIDTDLNAHDKAIAYNSAQITHDVKEAALRAETNLQKKAIEITYRQDAENKRLQKVIDDNKEELDNTIVETRTNLQQNIADVQKQIVDNQHVINVALDTKNKQQDAALEATKEELTESIATKQNNLTAGYNVKIEDDVISVDLSVMNYKGSVATITDLPATDNVIGDVYGVTDENMTYSWDGSTWVKLGSTDIKITVDEKLSETSENPVQNKIITGALNKIQDTLVFADTADIDDLFKEYV